MLALIEKIDKKIKKLQDKKNEIQGACSHPEIFYRYSGSTGNYDPTDDGYTFEYRCRDCDKWGCIEDPSEAHAFKLARETKYVEGKI
jgi:hypothetical protein